jgi:glycosyltransferase involved in cell wall biosynthesis
MTPFNYLTESGGIVRRAVRRADEVFCPAFFLREKVKRMYRLPGMPRVLPNLIHVPETVPPKSSTPTFTYVSRWDKRKRPWLFLELAHSFPEYRFVAVGRGSASAEAGFDRDLKRQYRDVPNLEITGFVNRFTEPERMGRILSETWVFVSTAAREGLPLTFLEAAAHGCSILSVVDPDGFASRFGAVVQDDNFLAAARKLLSDAPLERGRAAHAYVKDLYEEGKALKAHTDIYLDHAGTKGI